MKDSTRTRPLTVDIYWDSDALAGVAISVVDVLQMVNQLVAMRGTMATAAVSWRWRALGDPPSVPRWLPRGPRSVQRVADVAVVPGWHAQSGPQLDRLVQRSASAIPALQAVHRAGGQLAMVYNASALAARAGVLDGAQAAVPWPFIAPTLRQSDQVQIAADTPWTSCDRVWTCESPVWATQTLLDLLRHTARPLLRDLADSVAHVLLPAPGRQRIAALNIHQGVHGKVLPEGAVEHARRWLEAHMDQPYNLQATANAASTSPRTLLRHFSLAFGQTPLDFLHGLRVARAQVLLETSYASIEQIARMCGYTDLGTFRRTFVRATGKRPSDYRDQYRLRTSRKRWGEDLT